jgi:acyl-CoA reductase-like NAD-dependent aldehyde dehydrogenase
MSNLDQAAIDTLANRRLAQAFCLLDGRQKEAISGKRRPILSPIDGRELTTMPDCGKADVDAAVSVARKAFEARVWCGMPPKERKKRMVRWAELMDAEQSVLAVTETLDMGMPIMMAENLDIAFAIDTIRWYGELADKLYDEMVSLDDQLTAYISRTPLGVVAAILPWNAPAMIGAWKLGPALVTGNSLIVKPSEEASLVVLRMANLALEAGIPEGVIQVVTGGGEVGRALAEHLDVDCLTFTGSGGTGRALMHASADSNLKRVSLELGGKSANIVMADAPDLDMAADVAVGFMFSNQGQVCEAPSRLLVQNGTDQRFLDLLVDKARKLRIGNPLEIGIDLGPVINGGHHGHIVSRISAAVEAGVDLLLDGRGVTGLAGGSYLGATIADQVDPQSALAQEEIFGPVLSVIRFGTLEEAIAIANSTRYGLGASFWSSNIDDVAYATARLVAGNINVNGGTGPVVEMPFGGFKQSGFGRDRSIHAVNLYSDLKNVVIRRSNRS